MKKVKEGYKMTELGEIPEEWEVKSIGDIGKFQGGYAFKSEDYINEGVKLIRITNVQQCNLNWEDKCFLPKKFEEKFRDYSVKINDVVLAMTRSIISTGIKACKVKKQDVPSLLNQRVGRFILSNVLDCGFLYQYIFTDYFINKVNELSSTTGQPNISSKQIESIMVTVPEIREQQKIALILTSVDEQIEITDNLIEKTKELKKGLMRKLLTKGIGHSRFKETEIGKIPEKWEVKRLIDITDKFDKYSFTGGPFGSNLKSSDYTNKGVRVIQLQNIGDGYFNNKSIIYTSEEKADELNSCNIYPGDIIIAKMAEPVARACKIPNIEERYLMCSDGIRIAVDKSENDINFIMYSINSNYFRNNAIANSTGSTRLRIGLNELRNLPIVIPPLHEQVKIASIFSRVDEQINQYESEKEKLQELKKGLMQKLFSGKIRVQ